MTIRKIDLPDCCATCRFMRWEEYDMRCRHPANIPDENIDYDKFDDEEEGEFYYEEDGTELEHFACVCEHFQKGPNEDFAPFSYENETKEIIAEELKKREQKYLQDLELDAVRAHAARILDVTFDEVLNKDEN